MRSGLGGGTRARAVTRYSFLRTRKARSRGAEGPGVGSRGRSQGGNGPPGRRKKGRGGRGLEVYEAELGDFQMVSNLLVEAFYTDTKDEENNLSAMQRRGLERDQNLDLRARMDAPRRRARGSYVAPSWWRVRSTGRKARGTSGASRSAPRHSLATRPSSVSETCTLIPTRRGQPAG